MIRLGTVSDTDEILRLSHNSYQTTPLPMGDFSPNQITALVREFTTAPDKVLIVAEEHEQLFGYFAGFAARCFYADVFIGYELNWWVEPTHRKHKDTLKMFWLFEAWAEKVGCKHIQVSELVGWGELARFYTRQGYSKTETSYRKELS